MTSLIRFSAAVIFLCLGVAVQLFADWPCRTDSTIPIVNVSGSQWNLRVANDMKNGAIFVWQDRRIGVSDKLYIQRMSPSGVPLWAVNGLKLTNTDGYQYYPQILPDGKSGAFIVWQDNRSGADYDIYLQHVDANGLSYLTPNGLLVCGISGHQYNPQLASDGAGGVIVTWQDRRFGQFDIFAQRIDSLGQIRWIPNGEVVCYNTTDQIDPKITADGKGGAFIAWSDYRLGQGSTDIYCQRMLPNGQAAWTQNGLPICTAQNTQWNIQLVPDTIGGAILAWQDRRNLTYDNIYTQHIDPFGVIKWTVNGVQLAQESGNQYYPQMVSDWAGGAVIVWQDNRIGTNYDIYGQRISREGILLWGSSGLPVSTAIGHQYNPQIIVQHSYFIVTWQDKRHDDFDIYAQRLNLQGQTLWENNGNAVATSPFDQFVPQITIDSTNGAIIGWADYHLNNGSTDIYTQRIGANGLPGGGCFRTFIQDSLAVKSKRIKRSIYQIFNMPNAGNLRDSVFKRGVFPYGLCAGIERPDSVKKYGWIRYTRSNYIRRSLPQTNLSRPFDFMLDRPFVGQKKNLTANRYNNKLLGELLALKINIGASDVGLIQEGLGDIVFRDTTQVNPLNGKKLRQIVCSVDSMLTMWSRFKSVNYSLIATTLQRINLAFDGKLDTVSSSPLRFTSTKALFSVSYLRPSVDPPTPLPLFQSVAGEETFAETYVLDQNYPNPFNPLTTIEFTIPEPSTVTLIIYNLLGQEIASLIDRTLMEDDHYIYDFDASALSSGVYFYRLLAEPASGNEVRNLVKKMILIK